MPPTQAGLLPLFPLNNGASVERNSPADLRQICLCPPFKISNADQDIYRKEWEPMRIAEEPDICMKVRKLMTINAKTTTKYIEIHWIFWPNWTSVWFMKYCDLSIHPSSALSLCGLAGGCRLHYQFILAKKNYSNGRKSLTIVDIYNIHPSRLC